MLFVGVVLAQAEVRVTAGVDRPRMMLGDRIQFTIRVEGTKSNPQARLPVVDGLNFSSPSLLSNVQIINGQIGRAHV